VLPAGEQQAASSVRLYHELYTQSSAPEDGRNYRPKHVELIEIVTEIIIVASSWMFNIIVSMMLGYTDIRHEELFFGSTSVLNTTIHRAFMTNC